MTSLQAVNTRLTAVLAAAANLAKDVTWGAATASSSVLVRHRDERSGRRHRQPAVLGRPAGHRPHGGQPDRGGRRLGRRGRPDRAHAPPGAGGTRGRRSGHRPGLGRQGHQRLRCRGAGRRAAGRERRLPPPGHLPRDGRGRRASPCRGSPSTTRSPSRVRTPGSSWVARSRCSRPTAGSPTCCPAPPSPWVRSSPTSSSRCASDDRRRHRLGQGPGGLPQRRAQGDRHPRRGPAPAALSATACSGR